MFAHKSFFRLSVAWFKALVMLALVFGGALNVSPAGASSTLVVVTGADEQNTNGLCSLREAIDNANSDLRGWADCASGAGNDTILFANGIGTITLASRLQVTDNDGLVIDGGGDVTVSGNNSVQVFYVSSTAVLTLANVTVANGNSSGGSGVNILGTLAVVKSTFSGNHATGSGGGMLINPGGVASIRDSTFSANSAVQDGGGIDNIGGTVTVTNSTFSNNTANSGGGLMNNSSTAIIANATFSANSATFGAGIATWNGNPTLPVTDVRNTILANSITGADCWNGFGAGTLTGTNNIIETTPNCTAIVVSSTDPLLGLPTGSPAYLPLNSGSPAINAGDDAACAAAPVSRTSQNGIPRPQGAHCDIGSFEMPFTVLFRSVGAQDGWILESGESTSVGGTLNATAPTFNLGDDAANRQYRAILSFDTGSLPDGAVITAATLRIKKQVLLGTNPFSTHGLLRAYLRKPSFGTLGLQASDFQVAPATPLVAGFGATQASGWYSATLNNLGATLINRTGTTQLRLRFTVDDNNDHGADYMTFFSGNAPAVNQPRLLIEYYVP